MEVARPNGLRFVLSHLLKGLRLTLIVLLSTISVGNKLARLMCVIEIVELTLPPIVATQSLHVECALLLVGSIIV